MPKGPGWGFLCQNLTDSAVLGSVTHQGPEMGEIQKSETAEGEEHCDPTVQCGLRRVWCVYTAMTQSEVLLRATQGVTDTGEREVGVCLLRAGKTAGGGTPGFQGTES